MRSLARSFGRFSLAILILFMVLAAFHRPLLVHLAEFLDNSDPDRLPVKYAAILPGGNDTRTFCAAALYKAGFVQQVVILANDSVPSVIDGTDTPSHEITRTILRNRGVASDSIVTLQGTSTTTVTDAMILRQLWELDPDATVAVVTNDYHVRRASWIVKRFLSDHRDRVCFVSAPDDSFEWQRWWTSEIGASRVVSEYLKLVFYWIQWSSMLERIGFVLVVGLVVFAVMKFFSGGSTKPETVAETQCT